jgi:hypothetical protein
VCYFETGNFGKEAASLETRDIDELVRSAAGSLRKQPAIRRRCNVSYALVVKAGYEEILRLRADGYSYGLICEAFTENGLLPERSNPKALCSVFLREKKRREKKVQSSDAVGKNAIPKSSETEPVKPDSGASRAPTTEKAEDRAKALTGSAEETALGKLTKHADGSFDFDWKD